MTRPAPTFPPTTHRYWIENASQLKHYSHELWGVRQDVSALEGGDRAGLGARWAFCLPAGCSTCWPWPASLREAGCPCFLCMLVCFAMGCFALWSSGGIHACLERGRLLAAERGVPLALGEKNIYLLRLNIQIWGLGISQVLLSDTRILDVLLHNSDRHHGAPGRAGGRVGRGLVVAWAVARLGLP